MLPHEDTLEAPVVLPSRPLHQSSFHGRPLAFARAHTACLVGLVPHAITVEVSCMRGPPVFQMVGLAEAVVREARVRISSALADLGVLLDEYALTVNLAPAELRKGSPTVDLALALAILEAVGGLPSGCLEPLLLIGELSLDGQLQAVRGLLPQLHGAVHAARPSAIVPAVNRAEAGLMRSSAVWIAGTLRDVVAHLRGQRALPTAPETPFEPCTAFLAAPDLGQVQGQSVGRRALEIAAAGRHNLLMLGPPGAGKTMLARALVGILPPLTFAEALETTFVHSVAGLLDTQAGVVSSRPLRAPHHSVSAPGLIGGGSRPQPGEVSLAHHGVLFLDELAEFSRAALEALRQPLEDGRVLVTRAQARAEFPARPLVVAAMNPCPCGCAGHPRALCRCTPPQIARYRAKLSGPLLDRLDLQVQLAPVQLGELGRTQRTESSAVVRERVMLAREAQARRWNAQVTRPVLNADLSLAELEATDCLGPAVRSLLERAGERLGLSARGYLKVARVARTIADLEGTPQVGPAQIAEALQLRTLDRNGL